MSRSRASPKINFRDEQAGKECYRYAFAYAEKLDQQMRLIRDLRDVFDPDIAALRDKLQKKCEQVLFLSCSKRRNAEELLWRHVMYSVISQCKQHKEILTPTHPYHNLYNAHLISATVYYQQLLQNLQDHYQIHITKMTAQQLEEMETTNQDPDTLWLKEASQRCFIYLGDVARYQVDLGFSPEHATAFYQQAVQLDPANGSPYNQLAALSESQHQPFEAVFYYLRSMTATKPFPGVEKNIERLLRKNASQLTQLEASQETVKELQLPQFKKELLLAKFLQLQGLFLTSSSSTSSTARKTVPTSSEITSLCSVVSSLLEECLGFDEQLYTSHCIDIAQGILEKLDKPTGTSNILCPLLDENVLIKLSSLAVLPAYTLRLKGSADTLLACAFGFSVFSHLILLSYKKLLHVAIAVANQLKGDSHPTYEWSQVTESAVSLMDLLERKLPTTAEKSNGKAMPLEATASDKAASDQLQSDSRKESLKETAKKKQKVKPINRRRRRKRNTSGIQSSSSSEEEDGSSSSDGGSLSPPIEHLGEDDLDMIESLSESSSDGSDREEKPLQHEPRPQERPHPQPQSSKSKSRRQFTLAANFSLSNTATSTTAADDHTTTTKEEEALTAEIAKLHTTASHRHNVHLACLLVGEECYLTCLKVFVDWLISYPAVLATHGKSCNASIWSRLADLLNFFPSESLLYKSGLIETDSSVSWTQTCPVTEDRALRGFAPLLRAHQSLDFATTELPSQLQQAIIRIQCLIKFGHYIASLKTIPLFEFDRVSGQFLGPAQRERKEAKLTATKEKAVVEEAKTNRSKLMKLMAQQRLQSEVAALSVATAKTQAEVLFTPYLLPDAHTLCRNLHLIKKLMKTQKFVVVVAKSVIESLDLMKKEKDNFPAREAIKFLEKELREGNKFLRAQVTSETVNPGRKRPHKQELTLWLFENLVDCAIYFNTGPTPSSSSLASLLLDKMAVEMFEGTADDSDPDIVKLLTSAQQHGVEISTAQRFYRRWQKAEKK